MSTKFCTKCEKVLPIEDFGKESRSKDGLKRRCKKCINLYYNKAYKTNSKLKNNKIKKSKKYYQENKKRIIEKVKNRYSKEHIKKKNTDYYKKNKQKINKQKNKYTINRYNTDPVYAYERKMRSLVYRLRKGCKAKRTHEILGYTSEELMNHLGNQLISDMHLDHKIPVSWFKKNTPISIINHLSNLQMVTSKYNLKKLNKFADPVDKKYFEIVKDYVKKSNISKLTVDNNQ
jgi:hypothetical protein